MRVSVTYDVLGERSRKIGGTWELERVALVTGLTGDAHAQCMKAVEQSGLPAEGTAHPSHPKAKLQDYMPEPLGAGQVRVTMIYREQPEQKVVEVGAVLVDRQADTDVDGKLMVVEYTDPDGVVHRQAVTATVGDPRTTIRARRREQGSPGAKARTYVGKTNQGSWSLDLVAVENTWRCNSILGTTADNVWFDVAYEFEFAEMWDTVGAYIDPKTGRKPADLVLNKGLKRFKTVHRIDFNGLGL